MDDSVDYGITFFMTSDGLVYSPEDRCPECGDDPAHNECEICKGNGYIPGTELVTISEYLRRLFGVDLMG